MIEVLPEQFRRRVLDRPTVAVLPIGEEGNAAALAIARRLVQRGISAQTEVTGRSLKAGFKWAGKIGAQAAVILGENEIAEGTAIVRDLEKGEQETVVLEKVPGFVAGLIASESET